MTSNAQWQPFVEGSRMTINGIEMVLVPAGCFNVGNDPEGVVITQPGVPDGGRWCFDSPFYISRTEITHAQFDELGCIARSFDDSGPQQPRINVKWTEALDCANRAGLRLPTEAEWEYAARGPDGLFYPWGNEWNPDNAVWEGNSHHVTADVGSRPAGASWVGAMDMAGNVMEWTYTFWAQYPYRADLDRNPDPKIRRSLRGGSRLHSQNFLRSASRFQSPTDNFYNFVGFRLVYDPTDG